MEDYHPVPRGLAMRQVDGGGGNGIIRCCDAHDPTACLDSIKRRLVVRCWLPCANEGYSLLSRRSRTTGHNSETMPSATSRRPSVWPTRPAPISAMS